MLHGLFVASGYGCVLVVLRFVIWFLLVVLLDGCGFGGWLFAEVAGYIAVWL